MFEWLQSLFRRLGELQLQDVQGTDWAPLLAILVLSAASSMVLFLLYAVFFERRSTGSDVHRTFPVLGVSITAIFVCLQYSLPMSLGLLGALSIVRFRMPIKEPEEIGFLMALIASSICCATLNFTMLLLVLSLCFGLMLLLRAVPMFARSRRAIASVVVTTPNGRGEDTLSAVLDTARASGLKAALDAVTDCAESSTITMTLFQGDADALASLRDALSQRCPESEVSLFVNQPRTLSSR